MRHFETVGYDAEGSIFLVRYCTLSTRWHPQRCSKFLCQRYCCPVRIEITKLLIILEQDQCAVSCKTPGRHRQVLRRHFYCSRLPINTLTGIRDDVLRLRYIVHFVSKANQPEAYIPPLLLLFSFIVLPFLYCIASFLQPTKPIRNTDFKLRCCYDFIITS